MIKKGFKNVNQLHGGILNYLEKFQKKILYGMVSVLFLIIEFQLKMSSRMEHFSSVMHVEPLYQKHKLNQKNIKGEFHVQNAMEK